MDYKLTFKIVFPLILIILLFHNIGNITLIETFGKKGHDDKMDDDKSFRSIDKTVPISENNTIILIADQIQSTYLWKNDNGKYNPILTFNNNEYYKIITTSLPEDIQEHELIIETLDGIKLTESDEIEHGSSAELIFKYNGNNTQLKYYCEYHPQSMVGVINLMANKK